MYYIARLQFWLKLHLIYAMTSVSQIGVEWSAWKDWGKLRKTSLRIAGCRTEIWSRDNPHTKQGCYSLDRNVKPCRFRYAYVIIAVQRPCAKCGAASCVVFPTGGSSGGTWSNNHLLDFLFMLVNCKNDAHIHYQDPCTYTYVTHKQWNLNTSLGS